MVKILDRTFSIKQTQSNFSKFVGIYDFWGKLTESKAIEKAVSIFDSSNDMKVLDVGVGTGQLFERVIKINKNGINVGLDLSLEMISKAESKLKPSFNNFSLTIGNAFHLPYKAQSFNFLFSSYVFDLLPENQFGKVIDEFKRVLKPASGGIMITMSRGTKWYNKFWYLLAKYFPKLLTNCRPVDLSDHLAAAGFVIEERKQISQNTFASEIIKFKN
jgi:ubiquinone/menaquinone biosynthesis C-methylase UbiE